MSNDAFDIVKAVLSSEYKSWGSSTDTYTGQRAVQSVAERIAKAVYPGDELRQRAFVEESGCAT